MARLRRLLLVLVATAVAAGCGSSPATPGVTPGPEVAVELVGIDTATGTLSYHPAQYFEGAAAIAAAREDGHPELGQAFYVRVSPETRTARLDPGTTVELLVATDDGQSPVASSLSTFTTAFAHLRPPDPWLPVFWFWVRFRGAEITFLRQMHVV